VEVRHAYVSKDDIREHREHKGDHGDDGECVEGVPVELDEVGDQEVRMVRVAGPARLLVTVGDSAKQEAWRARKEK